MGSDWTNGPAKWAAVGALGCASVFGLAWSIVNHGAAVRGPGMAGQGNQQGAPAAARGDEMPAAGVPATQAPKAAPAPASPLVAPKATRTINLNTATQAELELLPGIGPALAGRILEERARVGRFSSVEQLDDVKGIGPKLMAKLRPLVRVE